MACTDDPGERSSDTRRLAHDLLQSVVIVEALVGSLRVRRDLDDDVHARLETAQDELRVMARLCDHHLDGERPRGGVDVAAVAARAVRRAKVIYEGEITLEIRPARLDGDSLDWERCVFNVIENACRAAGPTGKVTVRVWSDDDAVRVRVGDSGPGYGHTVTGRASLGMVTVTRVLDRHAGHLEVGQSSLGGAELTIVVPLAL